MLDIKDYKDELCKIVSDIDEDKLAILAKKIVAVAANKNMVFIAGNGGSSATASHMVCDIQKTANSKNEGYPHLVRIRALSLSDNTPLLTAWGNDANYNVAFSEQLKNMGNEGDLVIVITGSGNSKNIIELLSVAKEMKIYSFGFLGFDGGEAVKMVDDYILVESRNYGVVEDTHMILDHMLTELLKKFIYDYSKAQE